MCFYRQDTAWWRRFVSLVCASIALAGCGAGRPSPASESTHRSPMDASAAARAQLSWYLAAVAGREPIDEGVFVRHFAPAFLAKIPPATFRATTESLRSAVQRLDLVRLEPTGATEQVHAVTRAADGSIVHVLLAVEPEPTHRISGLQVRAEKDAIAAPPIHSWTDAERELRALAPRVSLLAANLDAGGCQPIHALAPDESLAVGSVYKLLILGALAREVEAGTRSWSDPLPGRDPRTLLSAAERMIARSENTAANDLTLALGRETVERFAKTHGVVDPRLVPLLLTHETFGLKYAASDEERVRFAKGDREQRLLLATQASTRKWEEPTAPSSVDVVGWFASLRGLCTVAASLHEMAARAKTAPVAQILAANPGIPDVEHAFSYVGFKGGEEPGIFHLSFVLQRARDGKWMYLAASLNDDHRMIDRQKAVALVGAIRSFLANSAVPSSS
jgi:Beta-lactamase enzyme family